MGEILAFSPRPPASDWSANERGLLMLLTQQLETAYGEVDGIFGQTDSGDPWYVVTDSNQDVLVHIARIRDGVPEASGRDRPRQPFICTGHHSRRCASDCWDLSPPIPSVKRRGSSR